MIRVAIVLALAFLPLLLVRWRLIHVDMTFPWFVALAILGVASISAESVLAIAAILGIFDAPLAIVFLTIFILLAMIVMLLIGLTSLRRRQIAIVRYLATEQLLRQETARALPTRNESVGR